MLFEVFLVAVVLKHDLWVTVGQPVSILQLRWTQLVLQFLSFTTTRDRSRQTWTGETQLLCFFNVFILIIMQQLYEKQSVNLN